MQDCVVKSQFGMMVHSQYDIGVNDFMNACDSHEFDVVWSCVDF